MIDSDQRPVFKAMIKSTYSPVILRTILHAVLVDLNEIRQSMKLTTKANLTLVQKLQLIDEELRSPQVKNALAYGLDRLKRQSGDVVNEVLRQYGLNLLHDEVDFYHEEMGYWFDHHAAFVEKLIDMGDYEAMRILVSECEQD